MENKFSDYESLHNKVINTTIKRLDSDNYDIYTNPKNKKINGIGLHYPDIILTKKGERTVKFIIAVETSESINIGEATNKWKPYATDIKASFTILVPYEKKNMAIHLCKQVGVSTRFGTYEINNLGDIINIKFE